MLENLKILCRGYWWHRDTPPFTPSLEDVSFFSTFPRIPFTPEIDLVDFLLDTVKLKYNFEDSEKKNLSGQLFFESGNMNLKLDSAVYINSQFPYLEDFFRIKHDTTYMKYWVKLYYNNELLFQGIVNQDGLKEQFTDDNESEIIECLVVGFEKEFRDYYRNAGMKNPNDIVWYAYGSENFDILSRPIFDMIPYNFNNSFITQFVYEDDLLNKHVMKHPNFKVKSWGLAHNRQGYERMANVGVTALDWFESLCNTMGWVYYIFRDKFYLKNRSGSTLPLVTYDFDRIVGKYEIGKKKPVATYDYIMIIDGAYYITDDPFTRLAWMLNDTRLIGERPIIISGKGSFNLQTTHFNQVAGSQGDYYSVSATNGYKFSKYGGEDNDTFRIQNFTVSGFLSLALTMLGIKQEKILRLDSASSGNEWWYANSNNGLDGPFDRGTGTGLINQMIFTGCAGSMLCEFGNPFRVTANYHNNFVLRPLFKNNFAKYLDAKTNIYMTVTIDEIVTDPFQKIKFINSGDSFFNAAEWGIQSMEFDFVEETTNFELLKNN